MVAGETYSYAIYGGAEDLVSKVKTYAYGQLREDECPGVRSYPSKIHALRENKMYNNPDINTPGSFNTVSIEGPFAGWCGSCIELTDNGSGLWSVTLALPAGPFEYKYAHDSWAGQEQLVDDMQNGGDCATITDFDTFANREITIPAVLTTSDIYGYCDGCVIGEANNNSSLNGVSDFTNEIRAIVYPNPNNGDRAFVELFDLSDSNDKLMIEIYDVFGKKVYSKQFAITSSRMIEELVFKSDLASGLYSVQISSDSSSTIKKMIIE